MRLLVLDPRFGAAGDMITGALLSAGADRTAVLLAMRSASGEPAVELVFRCGVPALHVRTNTGPAHRTLEDVLARVRAAAASAGAITLAEQVFARIASAEAKVHGTDHVHFHEVGADDAIADVLGACTALLSLGVDAVHILPVSTGSGTLTCAHGVLPVPAPATAEILAASDLTVLFGGFAGELCTPTGAALLAAFSAAFGTAEHTGRVLLQGFGAGTRDPADHPNVLRAVLMESAAPFFGAAVDVLETNVDDLSGELLSSAMSLLLDAGARDVCIVPVIMKKGRPGHLVRVICMPDDTDRLAKLLARETGSLGIRCTPMVHRFVAGRSVTPETVVINGGEYAIDVKTAYMDAVPYSRKAEFDQLFRAAAVAGVSVRDLKRIVEEASWKRE